MFAYGWPKVLASGGSDSSRVVALEYDERSAALAVVSSSGVEIWHCGQVSENGTQKSQTKTAWPKPATRASSSCTQCGSSSRRRRVL